MPKPTGEWTEDDVLSLPQGENDTFERKGTRLLDLTIAQVKEGDVLDELAKQLSAFANMGGGRIIYGLTNAGGVDNGGVSRSVRGKQSTKEWLEDVVPTLTDLEILGFNVYEVLPRATGSSVAPDKSLYIVDVPDSERAPHQSKRDLKYYIRLSGKSRPAAHRIIEDIRNRARHSKPEVYDLQIASATPGSRNQALQGLVSEFQLNINLRFGVRNSSRVRAANACLQLSATVPLSTSMGTDEYFLRPGTPGTVLLELRNPLYPGMGVILGCVISVWAKVQILTDGESSLTFAGISPDDVLLSIDIFADSAQAQKQEFKLSNVDPQQYIRQAAKKEVDYIRSVARRIGSPPSHTGWS
jgi:hypothetical protein